MIVDLGIYLAVFVITALMAYLYQRIYRKIRFYGFYSKVDGWGTGIYCVIGCLFLLPIIAMFSLRYGIGTDYEAYRLIFDKVNNVKFDDFLELHNAGESYYYIELGYYFLNILFPSYRLLLWGIGFLVFSLVLVSLKDYLSEISMPFAIFIYLCTQFIYSLNSMRFSIAVSFMLLGYTYLIKNETKKFIIIILVAALFHKSSLFCLAMILLKQYKRKDITCIRNVLLFIAILSFPFISSVLIRIVGNIAIFSRYFETERYSASEVMGTGWKWMLHIIPVFLPLLFFCRKEIFNKADTDALFRICIVEIPFRMLGLYNTWYTRFARCSQIAQVVFISLVLSRVENRQKRSLLYVYYLLWYIFYFAYYAVVNDQGDSLPYIWVFSRCSFGR